MTDIRNRIIEMRVITADEVQDNPGNWRAHPDRQRTALRGVLGKIGIAAPVVAYHSERYGGLTLIDGHERMTVGVPFPAAILDVSDDEADILLATFDPLGDIAETNQQAYRELLESISTDEPAIAQFLSDYAEEEGVIEVGDEVQHPVEQPITEQWLLVLTCRDEQHQRELFEELTERGEKCRLLVS